MTESMQKRLGIQSEGDISLLRAWIAQSVEHQTFNLRVQGSSPCSGERSFREHRAHRDDKLVPSLLLHRYLLTSFQGEDIQKHSLRRTHFQLSSFSSFTVESSLCSTCQGYVHEDHHALAVLQNQVPLTAGQH